MIPVISYMFRRPSAIFREPQQYENLVNYDKICSGFIEMKVWRNVSAYKRHISFFEQGRGDFSFFLMMLSFKWRRKQDYWWMMNWKWFGRKRSWPERITVLASTWRERQFANDLNRDSLCPTRASNPERPEYMSISYELRIPWRDRTFWFMYPTKFIINLAVYLQVINILRFCSEVVHLCSPDLLNMLKFIRKDYTELYFGVFRGISWLVDGSVQKELEIMSPGRKYTNLQNK